jgi:hypothetical protein
MTLPTSCRVQLVHRNIKKPAWLQLQLQVCCRLMNAVHAACSSVASAVLSPQLSGGVGFAYDNARLDEGSMLVERWRQLLLSCMSHAGVKLSSLQQLAAATARNASCLRKCGRRTGLTQASVMCSASL